MTDDGDWRVAANLTYAGRAVGGHLVVRDGMVTFIPYRLDRALGAPAFLAPLPEVVGIAVAPRTGNRYDGGLRSRLLLRMVNGAEFRFVVWRVRKTGRRLARAVELTGGTPDVDL